MNFAVFLRPSNGCHVYLLTVVVKMWRRCCSLQLWCNSHSWDGQCMDHDVSSSSQL